MLLLSVQHTYLPISVWKLTIYFEEGWFQNASSSLHSSSEISTVWPTEVDCWHSHIPINVSVTKQWRTCYIWGSLELSTLNHPWTYQVSYIFPLLALVLSVFLAEHAPGHFRLLILVAPLWMQASWLLTVLNMLEDISHRRSHEGCFSMPSQHYTL